MAERFWAKVDRRGPDDCWEWLAYRQRNGYGKFGRGGRGSMTTAHRVAYELTFGPIPDGLNIDHLCRNRGCVNPSHLEAVSQRVNLLRGETNSAKTHCVNGHEFTPENTKIESNGARRCLTCRREIDRRRNRARRAAAKARP